MDTHGGYLLFKALENGGIPGFGKHAHEGGSSGAARPGALWQRLWWNGPTAPVPSLEPGCRSASAHHPAQTLAVAVLTSSCR